MDNTKGETQIASEDTEIRGKFRLEAIAIIERYLDTLEIAKKTVEKNVKKKKEDLGIF